MKLFLIVLVSTLVSIVQGGQYGLLRVGPSSNESAPKTAANIRSGDRSLFEEDFSLAFRQLFGYQAGLCMSNMAASASMSLASAQLSMSLAQLSLSMAAGMSFGGYDPSDLAAGSSVTTQDGAYQVNENGEGGKTSKRGGLGAGAVAAITAVGVVAAVGLVAVVVAKNTPSSASSMGSVASFQPVV